MATFLGASFDQLDAVDDVAEVDEALFRLLHGSRCRRFSTFDLVGGFDGHPEGADLKLIILESCHQVGLGGFDAAHVLHLKLTDRDNAHRRRDGFAAHGSPHRSSLPWWHVLTLPSATYLAL